MALDEAFALHLLALKLPRTADGLGLLAGAPFGRLLVEFPAFHFTESPFALHLLLQRSKGLLDIVVAHDDGNDDAVSSMFRGGSPPIPQGFRYMRYRAAARKTCGGAPAPIR